MPAAGNMMTFQDVAAAPVVAAQKGNAAVMQFLFLGLIVVAFYFFLIRPQRNRQRRQQQLQSSVSPGARVLTTNGMYATVVAVDDDGLVLEIAPGVEARFVKQAIMQVVEQGDAEEENEDDSDEDEDEHEFADADDSADGEPTPAAPEEKAEEKSSSKPSA
jgi:preprotein translocase subunit YajC